MNENKNLQRAEGASGHAKHFTCWIGVSRAKWKIKNQNKFLEIQLKVGRVGVFENMEQLRYIDWFLWRVGASLDNVDGGNVKTYARWCRCEGNRIGRAHRQTGEPESLIKNANDCVGISFASIRLWHQKLAASVVRRTNTPRSMRYRWQINFYRTSIIPLITCYSNSFASADCENRWKFRSEKISRNWSNWWRNCKCFSSGNGIKLSLLLLPPIAVEAAKRNSSSCFEQHPPPNSSASAFSSKCLFLLSPLFWRGMGSCCMAPDSRAANFRQAQSSALMLRNPKTFFFRCDFSFGDFVTIATNSFVSAR